MTEMLSIPEIAEDAIKDLPAMCKPRQLGDALGFCSMTIIRHIESNHLLCLKAESGHRRIPKATQRKVAEALIRGGMNIHPKYRVQS